MGSSHTTTTNFVALAMLILASLPDASLADQTFVLQPQDTTVTIEHGGTGSFSLYCLVSTLEFGQKISWYKNNIIFADNKTFRDISQYIVDRNRYFMYDVNSPANIGYALLVTYITPFTAYTDVGPFKCAITTDGDFAVKTSRDATVTIYELPRFEHPVCTISDSLGSNLAESVGLPIILHEGVTYALTCFSDRGYPTGNIDWSRNDVSEPLQQHQSGTTGDGLLFITHFWTPSRLDNPDVNFTCTLAHPGMTSDRICNLQGFDILYAPTVEINSSCEVLTSPDDVIIFTCTPDSNPDVDKITWFYDNEEVIFENDRFTLEHFSLQISSFNDEENGVHGVWCEMTNSGGVGIANVTFVVDIQRVTTEIQSTSASTLTRYLVKTESTTIVYSTTNYVSAGDFAGIADQGHDTGFIAGVIAGGCLLSIVVIVIVTVVVTRRRREESSTKSTEKSSVKASEYDEIGQSNTNVTAAYAAVNVAFRNVSENTSGEASIDIQLTAKVNSNPGQIRTQNENMGSSLETQYFAGKESDFEKNANETKSTEVDRKTPPAIPYIKPKPKKVGTPENTSDKPAGLIYENVGPPANGESVADDIVADDQIELDAKQRVYEDVHEAHEASPKATEKEISDERLQNADARDEDPRYKNVENLTYADLDLSSITPRHTTKPRAPEDDDVVYAELRL